MLEHHHTRGRQKHPEKSGCFFCAFQPISPRPFPVGKGSARSRPAAAEIARLKCPLLPPVAPILAAI